MDCLPFPYRLKKQKDIMNRPPRPQQTVLPMAGYAHDLNACILMAGISLSAQAWAINNNLHWQTIVFNVLCLSQMGHVLAIRSEKQSLFSIWDIFKQTAYRRRTDRFIVAVYYYLHAVPRC